MNDPEGGKLERWANNEAIDYLLPFGNEKRLRAFVRSPYFPQSTDDIPRQLGDREWWEAIEFIWTGDDFPCRNEDFYRKLFSSSRPGREHLMTDGERARLAALPDQVTIYRGASRSDRMRGLSWTLDRERAIWFARRFAVLTGKALLATATIPRERIIALFDGRNESEVIVLDLSDVEVATTAV